MDFTGTERFSVVRRLGEGGMGVVYEVLDRERDAAVALKLLRKLAPSTILRFKTEFRALQGLVHENLVSLGELFEERRQWFFTMELVLGEDFLSFVGASPSRSAVGNVSIGTGAETASFEPIAATVNEEYRCDIEKLRFGLMQLAQGLSSLHAANKVHRDVKPSNIRVTPSGRVVLLDFGLVTEPGLAHEPGLCGTVPYMAPEQADGSVTPAADWYSVGTLLYHALSGRLPFSGTPGEILAAKREQQRPVRPSAIARNVPDDLERLCQDLLSPCPEDRPGAADILQRLSCKPRYIGRALASVNTLFVGRETELSFLRDRLDELSHGHAVTVFVHGDSGMGKSALLRQWTESLQREEPGVVVLQGRCFERESIRYKAIDGVIDSLTRYLSLQSSDEVIALLPRRADLLVQAFAVLGQIQAFAQAPKSPYPVFDAIQRRNQTFGAFRELFCRLADRKRLVVVIDDLQWADPDSLALLTELMHPPEAPAFLLIGAFRTSLSGRDSELGDDFGDVRHLQLGPLVPRDSRNLTSTLLGDTAANSDAAEQIAVESRGHPFFIQEIVRHIRSTGVSSLEGLRLDAALEYRLNQLDSASRAILQIVCLAGAPIQQSIAASASNHSFSYFIDLMSQLRVNNLLKTSGPRPGDRVEPYHDRIRETVLKALEPKIRTAHHRALAVAIESYDSANAENLATHWLGAGEQGKAAEYAIIAANQALASMAFDRAVQLYRMALELLERNAPQAPGLQMNLAQALINTGTGIEAARLYLDIAHKFNPERALDIKRRAAEQLLRYGLIKEGLGVLGDVLASIDMKVPMTQTGALASLAWTRLKLRIRGLGFGLRPSNLISARELHRIDTCQSIALGLSLVEPIRAADFQTRALLLSLNAGDSDRIAQALSMEGMFWQSEGADAKGIPNQVLARARTLAKASSRTYTQAFLEMAEALCIQQEGRFVEAVGLFERSADKFRQHCPGALWELDCAEFFLIWTLALLGQFNEVHKKIRSQLLDGKANNDRATIHRRNFLLNISAIGADDIDTARRTAELAISEWKYEQFTSLSEDRKSIHLKYSRKWTRQEHDLQHRNAIYSVIQTELYAGDASVAYERCHSLWPILKKSLALRLKPVNVLMSDLRARCSLAIISARSDQRRRLLREVEHLANRIERAKVHQAPGFSAVLRSQVAHLRGRSQKVMLWLDRSLEAFEGAQMKVHIAAIRWRKGQLLGGPIGQGLVNSSRALMEQCGVKNPERMLAMLTPGFGHASDGI